LPLPNATAHSSASQWKSLGFDPHAIVARCLAVENPSSHPYAGIMGLIAMCVAPDAAHPEIGQGLRAPLLVSVGRSRVGGGHILVFHFPCVIQRMKRGVPNQIPERPGAGWFALGMERPNGRAIGIAVRPQTFVGQ
jgi:hypothetical protein